MDYRIYEALLDPVLILSFDGTIKYINPSGLRWVGSLQGQDMLNQNVSKFVQFKESAAFNSMPTLEVLAHTTYHLTHFVMNETQFESTAKICVQRLSDSEEGSEFAIIIRDRVFIKALFDDDNVKFNLSSESTSHSPYPPNAPPPEIKNILDTSSMGQAIPKDRQAALECNVNLVVVDIQKACLGKSVFISDHWIEVAIKPTPGIKVQMKTNIEVAGDVRMRGFSTIGAIESIQPMGGDIKVRFSFATLSPLARRALDEFLELKAFRF